MPKIDAYSFGRMSVDGTEYDKDLIVTPEGVRAEWWRKKGHSLCLEDLAAAFEAEPEVLVVGTGAYGLMRVGRKTRETITARGIRCVVVRTAKATEEFNSLSDAGQRVVGAFHLTC